MITLIGSLFGFLASLVPDAMKLFQDKQDREHELAVLDRQMEQQKLGFSERVEELRVQADGQVAEALYKTYATGIKWVDAFNGTVRPALAYAFFFLYAGVKLGQCRYLLTTIATPFDVLNLLWGAEDQALFAAVISFYFGQRAMRKVQGTC